MELIVLGSGAFSPARRPQEVRNPAGYAVRLPSGLLLFDIGFGNSCQLARLGLREREVTDVFLPHRHPDHAGDLAALLFHFRYDEPPRRGRLRVWGPKGTAAFVRRLRRTFAPWLDPRGYRLEVKELGDGGAARGRGWRVEALSAPHHTPALSYRLSCGRRSAVFSGDTGPNERLAGWARGCGLLVLEATLPCRQEEAGHLNCDQALALAQAAQPGLAVFSHLSPESAAGLRRLLKRTSGLRAVLAADGLRLRVRT